MLEEETYISLEFLLQCAILLGVGNSLPNTTDSRAFQRGFMEKPRKHKTPVCDVMGV